MRRMKKEDAETAKRMFRSGKSIDFIIIQFQEYDPLVVLRDMSSLGNEYPEFREDRKAYVGKYILKTAKENHWDTYQRVSEEIGFSLPTLREYMGLAEEYGYETFPDWFMRGHKTFPDEIEEAVWNDYMGYRDGRWAEKYIMTAKAVCEKYGVSRGRLGQIINDWSEKKRIKARLEKKK